MHKLNTAVVVFPQAAHKVWWRHGQSVNKDLYGRFTNHILRVKIKYLTPEFGQKESLLAAYGVFRDDLASI